MERAGARSRNRAMIAAEEISEALGTGPVRIAGNEQIKPDVHRLHLDVDGAHRSVVAKWSDPLVARRCSLVARRWLPAVGLAEHGPPLLAVVASRDGEGAWHLYEDLAGAPLSSHPAEHEVEAAMDVLARLHTSFARHRLLPECRHWGGDRGLHFYTANLHDACIALTSLDVDRQPELAGVRDVLVERVELLRDQEPERAQALAACGPDTLLHGDPWPENVIVPANGSGGVRLIDWDEAAVGPAAFDLSTILLRFDGSYRPRVLAAYERALARLGGDGLPAADELEVAMRTAAEARLASLLVWSIAAANGTADWLPERLTAMVDWLDAAGTVLPAR
jgi:Ser/Thr protein kinase RdoA (MazF antagonist)